LYELGDGEFARFLDRQDVINHFLLLISVQKYWFPSVFAISEALYHMQRLELGNCCCSVILQDPSEEAAKAVQKLGDCCHPAILQDTSKDAAKTVEKLWYCVKMELFCDFI
jgi:hypothetical protein